MSHDTHPLHAATAITGTTPYRTEIRFASSDAYELISDAPQDVGGGSIGPSPVDLLTGALGACKTMTAMMYARRKGWSVESISIAVRHVQKASEGRRRDAFECEIRIKGDLDEDQRARIVEIAGKCPIQSMLAGETPVESTLVQE